MAVQHDGTTGHDQQGGTPQPGKARQGAGHGIMDDPAGTSSSWPGVATWGLVLA